MRPNQGDSEGVVMSELRKMLGKIQRAEIGHGGYQDAMFGLSVTLGGEGWGVGDFKGGWNQSIKSAGAQWSEKDRDREFSEMCRYVDDLLRDAKVDSVSRLIGVPVEVTLCGNRLKSWRILTEVR